MQRTRQVLVLQTGGSSSFSWPGGDSNPENCLKPYLPVDAQMIASRQAGKSLADAGACRQRGHT